MTSHGRGRDVVRPAWMTSGDTPAMPNSVASSFAFPHPHYLSRTATDSSTTTVNNNGVSDAHSHHGGGGSHSRQSSSSAREQHSHSPPAASSSSSSSSWSPSSTSRGFSRHRGGHSPPGDDDDGDYRRNEDERSKRRRHERSEERRYRHHSRDGSRDSYDRARGGGGGGERGRNHRDHRDHRDEKRERSIERSISAHRSRRGDEGGEPAEDSRRGATLRAPPHAMMQGAYLPPPHGPYDVHYPAPMHMYPGPSAPAMYYPGPVPAPYYGAPPPPSTAAAASHYPHYYYPPGPQMQPPMFYDAPSVVGGVEPENAAAVPPARDGGGGSGGGAPPPEMVQSGPQVFYDAYGRAFYLPPEALAYAQPTGGAGMAAPQVLPPSNYHHPPHPSGEYNRFPPVHPSSSSSSSSSLSSSSSSSVPPANGALTSAVGYDPSYAPSSYPGEILERHEYHSSTDASSNHHHQHQQPEPHPAFVPAPTSEELQNRRDYDEQASYAPPSFTHASHPEPQSSSSDPQNYKTYEVGAAPRSSSASSSGWDQGLVASSSASVKSSSTAPLYTTSGLTSTHTASSSSSSPPREPTPPPYQRTGQTAPERTVFVSGGASSDPDDFREFFEKLLCAASGRTVWFPVTACVPVKHSQSRRGQKMFVEFESPDLASALVNAKTIGEMQMMRPKDFDPDHPSQAEALRRSYPAMPASLDFQAAVKAMEKRGGRLYQLMCPPPSSSSTTTTTSSSSATTKTSSSAPVKASSSSTPVKASSSSPSASSRGTSSVVVLLNVVRNVAELNNDASYNSLFSDVRDEAYKHGFVKMILIPRVGPGLMRVFIEYRRNSEALAAIRAFKRQNFDGTPVLAKLYDSRSFAMNRLDNPTD